MNQAPPAPQKATTPSPLTEADDAVLRALLEQGRSYGGLTYAQFSARIDKKKLARLAAPIWAKISGGRANG